MTHFNDRLLSPTHRDILSLVSFHTRPHQEGNSRPHLTLYELGYQFVLTDYPQHLHLYCPVLPIIAFTKDHNPEDKGYNHNPEDNLLFV